MHIEDISIQSKLVLRGCKNPSLIIQSCFKGLLVQVNCFLTETLKFCRVVSANFSVARQIQKLSVPPIAADSGLGIQTGVKTEFLQKRGSISNRLLSFGANILQIKSQVLNRIANSLEKRVLNCNIVSKDLRETIESGPRCIRDLFQNKPVVYF